MSNPMQEKIIEGLRPEKLDFEFVCHYTDGSVMRQGYGTPHEKHFGHIDQETLKVFELTDGTRHYSLDLETGEFDLNGLKCRFDLGFRKENGQLKHLDIPKYRLLYYRRIRNDFAPGGVTQIVRYLLGWQTEIDGKNYQRIVVIEPDGSVTFINKR